MYKGVANYLSCGFGRAAAAIKDLRSGGISSLWRSHKSHFSGGGGQCRLLYSCMYSTVQLYSCTDCCTVPPTRFQVRRRPCVSYNEVLAALTSPPDSTLKDCGMQVYWTSERHCNQASERDGSCVKSQSSSSPPLKGPSMQREAV